MTSKAMKKTLKTKSLASAALALAMGITTALGATEGMKPVFVDEFDQPELNRSLWTTTMAFIGRSGARHHNPSYLSYSTDEDAIVHDGTLRLRVDAIGLEGSDPVGRFDYTQGFVSTRESFSFTYGYVEVRAKLPGGRGMWPTIWLMPVDDTWPPEFDIVEYYATGEHVRFGLATGTMRDVVWDEVKYNIPGVETEWHTYSLLWEPGHAVFMFDGEVKLEVRGAHVPDKPMYLILNNGVSSRFGPSGEPDGSTVFPSFFEVDYVRVYQHPDLVPKFQP